MVDIKRIVEEYMDAICRHDYSMARHMMHEDYSFTSGDGQRQKGTEAGIGVAQMFGKAFPDIKFEIKNMYLIGNIVVTEFDFTGTHHGDLMGIAPTHHEVRVPTCNVTEIRQGKIYAEHEYFDRAHLMQQLGVEAGQEHHA
ncbi:MAG: ester cyclase [Methylococcaceae bacterium]|nr:ester cyclase [Prolixibacteraceae bacterium]